MSERVVIIGGGIAGLAAAHELADRPGLTVTVLESSERLGGKLHTEPFGDLALDTGPDAFLARRPEAITLCRELGIDGELVSPNHGTAHLWSRGRLRRLPAGLMLGIPTDFIAVARSGILSIGGLLRAAVEPLLPGGTLQGDVALGALVRRRLGDEVHERLVDPLVGGINAGDTDQLGIRSVAPQLADLAASHRSLVIGSRRHRPPKAAPGQPLPPVFLTHPAGLGRIVEALDDRLTRAGVELRLASPVIGLARAHEGQGFSVETHRGVEHADRVIVATPAPVTARLLASIAPDAAGFFESIEHASVVLVALSYARGDFPEPLDGSGFLVPRGEGFLTTACSWVSSKWAHVEAGAPNRVLLRISAGRVGDERAMALDDAGLVARLASELGQLMNLTATPIETRVTRWPEAFPQFAPGHLDRVRAMKVVIGESIPGLALAGAALGGVGIPACIQSGRQAAAGLAALGNP
ncbi:MAG: protoporphyrinogen oxidase [Actinobacteria bacterium]|nr:protoporphyrinogen oxidase [Actinomycetota bacterium]